MNDHRTHRPNAIAQIRPPEPDPVNSVSVNWEIADAGAHIALRVTSPIGITLLLIPRELARQLASDIETITRSPAAPRIVVPT